MTLFITETQQEMNNAELSSLGCLWKMGQRRDVAEFTLAPTTGAGGAGRASSGWPPTRSVCKLQLDERGKKNNKKRKFEKVLFSLASTFQCSSSDQCQAYIKASVGFGGQTRKSAIRTFTGGVKNSLA